MFSEPEIKRNHCVAAVANAFLCGGTEEVQCIINCPATRPLICFPESPFRADESRQLGEHLSGVSKPHHSSRCSRQLNYR
uniref:Uncharacterized protein n=1 Tax=Anguilla anguilla TaxID=7936 RepID=A0A0E9RWM0_ANGAN